jgi:hypothetical protein
MQYIYHAVPENMVGDSLIPLNLMPESMTVIHDAQLAKYEGREHVLEHKIPLLDCLWNDVVQFTPVHPKEVFELQVKMGIIPKIPAYRYFEIDLTTFDPTKTAIFFKTAPGEENSEVKWLKDVNFADLTAIPEATKQYYQGVVGTGELPFNYQFIPHVLHKGPVDVSKSQIITIV